MNDDVIDVRDQVAVLRRRWLTLVVMILVGVGAAAVLSLTQTRMYSAQTQLLVEPLSSTSTSNGVVMTPEEVATQVEVITSVPVAATVVHDLGLEETPETLLKSVTVASVSDTRVLTISVLRPQAGGAAAIANSFADAYLKYRTEQAAEQRRAATQSYHGSLTTIRRQLSNVSDQIETAGPSEKPGLLAQQQALTIQYTQVSAELATLNSSELDALGGGQPLIPATIPTSPAQPRPLRSVLLGGIVGLLLGVGVAFIRDHFDDGIRDEARLRDATSGRPVLGQIPHWSDERTGRLATIIDPSSPVSEAYRALSTNVRFMLAASRDDGSSESPGRILLVSSASPSEGKTSVSGNLAVAAARVGLQVVLVDADLRHPMLSRSFGLDDSPGLSDVLASGDSAGDYLIDVGVPNLRLLAGGSIPPNPAELLASTAAASVLRQLRDDADLLIVDSAPVLRVADALELMTTADLVLLVARRGVSHMRAIAATAERINQAGGRVSGSVLNDIDSRTSAYTYGYHAPVTRTTTRPAEPALAGAAPVAPASDAGLGILRDRYTAGTVTSTPGFDDTLDADDQAGSDEGAGSESSPSRDDRDLGSDESHDLSHDRGSDIADDLEADLEEAASAIVRESGDGVVHDAAMVPDSGDDLAHDAAADPDAAAPSPNGSDTTSARDAADPAPQKPHEADSTASRPRSPRSAGQRR